MRILYREATPADAARLLDYLNTVGSESDNLSFGASGIPLPVEREEDILANLQKSERSTMLLALDGDTIVGNGSIEGSSRPRFSHRRSLAITVRKDHWGQGIGTALMERLIAFCRETGAELISLEVRSDNERAKSLYRKFGFQCFGTFEKYFKINDEYFGADYMTLEL